MAAIGLVEIKSVSDLEAEASEKEEQENKMQTIPVMDELASHVLSRWHIAERNKQPITNKMEDALRQRDGRYKGSKLHEIKKNGGSEIFMKLSDEKSNGSKSWIYDIIFQVNELPFGVNHTPIPDLNPDEVEILQQTIIEDTIKQAQMGQMDPEQTNSLEQETKRVAQEVKKEANKLAKKFTDNILEVLKDITVEGGWEQALKETIADVVDLPVGVLKGPVVRNKPTISWVQDSVGNQVPSVTNKVVKEFERVSPFDIYPSPISKNVDDGFLIEKHRLTRTSLSELIGVDGYNEKHIKMVLDEYDSGASFTFHDEVTEELTGHTIEQDKDDITEVDPDQRIEALQFWDFVSGRKLKDYGLGIKKENYYTEYAVEVWLVGTHIIRAAFNADPLGRKPYYKASFRERNGSFWGESLLDIISDIQDMCNATARHLVNNMAISSGPQVGVDASRLAEGEEISAMTPWKIWQFDEEHANTSGGRQPVWFFQPTPMVNELMGVYQFFSTEADNKTGVPKYVYGAGGSGAAFGTATGMSMMMGNASKGIKQVIGNIDKGIIEPSIERIYDWLMVYSDDPTIKGDVKIQAKGSSALLAKEQQQVRRNEFLNIALNPAVLPLLGKRGLTEIIRRIGDGLELGIADVLPTPEELELIEKQEKAMMAPVEFKIRGRSASVLAAPL